MQVSLTLSVFLGLISLSCGSESSVEWCYTEENCKPAVWVSTPFGQCNGQRQSPIDIDHASAGKNNNLTEFNFTQYNQKNLMTQIVNSGHSVQVNLAAGVEVSGGGLNGSYSAKQFHFHWGNGHSKPGSEHRVNGMQYPMEMHIVHYKKGLSTEQVMVDPSTSRWSFLSHDLAWAEIVHFLHDIPIKNMSKSLSLDLSLDDLLSGVNRSRFYRYPGSLTTPNCNEVVVWTVFQQPITISPFLIDQFAQSLHVVDGHVRKLVDVFRPPQPINGRRVQASPGVTAEPWRTTPHVHMEAESWNSSAARSLPVWAGCLAVGVATFLSFL
ncbi:carbonic anhydrase 4-like [Polyodon spathula]|uniref:carbonic anhydrase 4-like n=1 Tax=Polyodon spathula TaxID=7913 RepID=UPI001B7E7E31|nr:carbonic anhydrase 4-like [Polyodon spathula]